jgi:hypothetical protein
MSETSGFTPSFGLSRGTSFYKTKSKGLSLNQTLKTKMLISRSKSSSHTKSSTNLVKKRNSNLINNKIKKNKRGSRSRILREMER